MPKWLGWLLLAAALVFGVLGGILAAQVTMILFWVFWALGLACLGFYFYKVKDEAAESCACDTKPESKPSIAEDAAEPRLEDQV